MKPLSLLVLGWWCGVLFAGSAFAQDPEAEAPTPDPAAPAEAATEAAEFADNVEPVASDAPTLAPTSAPPPGPGPAALQALPSGSRVAVIPIEGMIYDFTLESLQRRVDRALAGGATVIVIELDTPGGVVTSAIDIAKYLKGLSVPTVAWINDQAYSAGSLLATACDFIVMSPSSTFGDSAPVLGTGGEMAPTERSKALAPILAEYKDNARAHGYDYAPLHAMCVLGVEVYFVEHLETGERRLVNQVDYAVMVQGLSPQEADDAVGAIDPEDESGKLSRPVGTVLENERGKWRAVEVLPSGATLPNGRVHDGSSLYTPSQTEATDIGLAAAIVPDKTALRTRLNAASVASVNQTWSESLAGFLTNPFVRGVLVLAVLVGAYVEFQSPGLGFPGAVAGLSLIVLLVAPFLVGLAEVWHVLIMLLGLTMLIIELVATPTFGLMGIAGIVMVIAGLALSIVPTGGTGPLPMPAAGTGDLLIKSSLSTLGAFVLAAIAMVVLTQFYGRLPLLNRLIIADEPRNAGRPGVAAPRTHVGGDHALGGLRGVAVGDTGVVNTGLRPAGRVEVHGDYVDAVSTGEFLEPGIKVRVVEVHGNRIVVDAVDSA